MSLVTGRKRQVHRSRTRCPASAPTLGCVSLSRRELLLRGAVLASAATLPSATPGLARPRVHRHTHRRRLLAAGEFDCGVAAGLPGQRSALLWTRVGGVERGGRL